MWGLACGDCARAVKGTDLKSVVETLVGSNPTGRDARLLAFLFSFSQVTF